MNHDAICECCSRPMRALPRGGFRLGYICKYCWWEHDQLTTVTDNLGTVHNDYSAANHATLSQWRAAYNQAHKQYGKAKLELHEVSDIVREMQGEVPDHLDTNYDKGFQ